MPKTDGSGADSGWSSLIETLPSVEILESLPESIVVTTTEAEIVFANGLARELLGRGLDEVRGSPIDAVLVPVRGETASPRWQASCRRPDGGIVDIEVVTGSSFGTARHLVTLILRAVDAPGEGPTFDAESRLRAVIEQISAITYTWSWRGDVYEVLYCSPQIETILGTTLPSGWPRRPIGTSGCTPRTAMRSSGRTSDVSYRASRSPSSTGCSARTAN